MNIHIPTPLRAYTGGEPTVSVPGATVGDALEQLTGAYPALRQHLYTGDGKLRSFVNIYLNDDDIRYQMCIRDRRGDCAGRPTLGQSRRRLRARSIHPSRT